jgi:chromosomal replication initiation ATPase DnaA
MVSGVCRRDIIGPYRYKFIVAPRFAIYWLCYNFTSHSFVKIGYLLGRRDHSTIINGVANVESNYLKYEPLIIAACDLLNVDVPARHEFVRAA